MQSKTQGNIYLEKIAEDKDPKQLTNGQKAMASIAAGGIGLNLGHHVAEASKLPGSMYVRNKMRSIDGVTDVSDETVSKFVNKYKVKHFEIPEEKVDAFNPFKGVGDGPSGPHAMPRGVVSDTVAKYVDPTKLSPEAYARLTPDNLSTLSKMKKMRDGKYDGFIDMKGHKSNAAKLHELGHLVNQKKYRLADMRAAGQVGGVVSKGMLFSKDHAEDAWKVHALSHIPMLADELGTNARAYNFIKKHEPSALKKGKVGLVASAVSYSSHAAGGTLGMYAAGKFSKGVHDKIDAYHEKKAVSISSMMPAKPKVAIGVNAALSRSGALARARNAIPSGNFGSKAIAKLATDLGNNPFGGKVKDDAVKRVLPDEVHHAADLLVDGVKGVGEVGKHGLQHLLGSKVTNHVAHHTGQTFEQASKLSIEGMREVLKEKPEALGKLNHLIKMRTGVRTLAGGGAAYAAFKKLSEPKVSQPQYYDYGNY